MSTSGIKAFAPATISNILCSFNTIAAAVEQPGMEAIVSRGTTPEISVVITGQTYTPEDRSKLNYIVQSAVQSYLTYTRASHKGIHIIVKGKTALQSLIGIEAAAVTATLFALDGYFKNGVTKSELFVLLRNIQHFDSFNVSQLAACIFGGFQLVTNFNNEIRNQRIPCPPGLAFALHIPYIKPEERKADLAQFTLEDIRNQISSMGGFISGMNTTNFDLIKQSLNDYLIEPQIKDQIPGFDKIKELTVSRETLGIGFAGKGPALFTLATNSAQAEETGKSIHALLRESKISSEWIVTNVNHEGVSIC